MEETLSINTKKVLVITMFSDENEYESNKNSVSDQKASFQIKQCFIENKKNLEAHNELYKIIMDKAKSFDYFIKLDADMILTNKTALSELIRMAVDSNSDIFSIPVHDYMTNQMIWGVNVYKSGVKWKLGTENLFTDQQHLDGNFHISKKRLLLKDSLVSHASMPSDFQAFAFGVHRAAKVIQADSSIPLLGHAFGQFKTLKDVYLNYMNNKNRSLGLALIGAYMMLTSQLSRKDMLDKNYFLDDYKKMNYEDKLDESLSFFNSFGGFRMISVIGYTRFVLGLLLYAKRKIKQWK